MGTEKDLPRHDAFRSAASWGIRAESGDVDLGPGGHFQIGWLVCRAVAGTLSGTDSLHWSLQITPRNFEYVGVVLGGWELRSQDVECLGVGQGTPIPQAVT